jgi:hypothetical protein
MLHHLSSEVRMQKVWDLHEPAASSRAEYPSQAMDSNDNEPPFIDRKQTVSAKTPSSACPVTVPIAY